jgi:hypothetical protein
MKKYLFPTVTLLILIMIGVFLYILFKPRYMMSPAPLKLTQEKIISDPILIESIVVKKISPLGNKLDKIWIDEDDPDIMDEPWRAAFYVCRPGEHSGWILDYSGGDKAKPTLYGPFSWCLI